MATRKGAPRRKRTAQRIPVKSLTPDPTQEDSVDDDEPEPSTQHPGINKHTAARHQASNTPKPIHPYIKQDLRESEIVDIYPWVEAAFGVPRHRIDEWTSKIGELKWFDDKVIQKALKVFCADEIEPAERYQSVCNLANRIISLARGNLPHIPNTHSYPVDSITFVADPHAVASIPEHGETGASRHLDVTVTHGKAYGRILRSGQIAWADVLHTVKLKRTNLPLADILADEKKKRKAAAGQPGPAKATTSKSKVAGRPGPRRHGRNTKSTVIGPSGIKRKREDTDILTGLDLDESYFYGVDDRDPYYDIGCTDDDDRENRRRKLRLQKGKEAALQAGSHALELLSCTYGTRVCAHSTILEDDMLVFMYFDACGIIYTKQYLSLIEDFEKAAAIILALARCTPERFGLLPASVIKPPTSYRELFPPRNLAGSVLRVKHPVSGKQIRVTLKDSLYSQYILSGRRTFAYSMKASPQLSTDDLMVKLSYQVDGPRIEYELIKVAREAGVRHLPDVHMWADLWKMSDGARRAFYGEQSQTNYEDRTLRMIVCTEYGSIKALFSERCDLMPVMVNQMINCLHNLRYKANMLHRDVSVDNIMFQIRGGKYYFILNDFDMATVLEKDDGSPYVPTSKHRTGTLPFMATSLVHDAYVYMETSSWKPTGHLLRHDFESLYWVCLWCVLTLHMGSVSPEWGSIHRKMLRAWEESELLTVQGVKLAHSTTPLKKFVQLPPRAVCLSRWFDGWVWLLCQAHGAFSRQAFDIELSGPDTASAASYDDESANGILSKENILAVLTPRMPFNQDDGDEDISEPPAPEVHAAASRRRPRAKTVSAEATAAKSAIMSRLRPRKAT